MAARRGPVFLCRRTELVGACERSLKPVNVKKGRGMPAEGGGRAVAKVCSNREGGGKGTADIAVTERGTFFGYGDLVVDMRNFKRLRDAARCAVLFDATHAVQQPGRGARGSSAGTREHVAGLLMAAAAAGADGFFIETHPQPESAPSDSATMWPLEELGELVERAMEVWEVVRGEHERVL